MHVDSIGQILSNLGRAIAGLFTTGSWQAEKAADDLQSAEAVIDRIPEAAEQDAQRVLDIANRGLTSFGLLEQKLEAAEREVAKWQANVATATAKYNACPTEDAERKTKLEALLKGAIKERIEAEGVRDRMKAVVEQSTEAKEAALKAVTDAGLRREDALSQAEVLRIQDASALAQQNLAAASMSGAAAEAKKLVAEAEVKVMEHIAGARATKQVADALPADADDIASELEQDNISGQVDAEFAALTAEATLAQQS